MSQDIFLTSLNSGVEIFKITADNTLVFNSGIAVNITTGEVSIPNGLGFSEESKQFWDGVGLFAKARISELESENVWLRDQITAAREALCLAPSGDEYRPMALCMSATGLPQEFQEHIARYDAALKKARAALSGGEGE